MDLHRECTAYRKYTPSSTHKQLKLYPPGPSGRAGDPPHSSFRLYLDLDRLAGGRLAGWTGHVPVRALFKAPWRHRAPKPLASLGATRSLNAERARVKLFSSGGRSPPLQPRGPFPKLCIIQGQAICPGTRARRAVDIQVNVGEHSKDIQGWSEKFHVQFGLGSARSTSHGSFRPYRCVVGPQNSNTRQMPPCQSLTIPMFESLGKCLGLWLRCLLPTFIPTTRRHKNSPKPFQHLTPPTVLSNNPSRPFPPRSPRLTSFGSSPPVVRLQGSSEERLVFTSLSPGRSPIGVCVCVCVCLCNSV